MVEEGDTLNEELHMIRSLLRAESSRDNSEIQRAHEEILRRSAEPTRKKTRKSKTPVARLLRHSKQRHPVIVEESAAVREVAELLSAQRQSAALVVRGQKLVGICSEVDICRRLVGAGLELETCVSSIMTADPYCVDPDEDLSVVLELMVKHRFRHLPVVAESICGLVDITQCLYDAIHKIERLQENQAEFFKAVERAKFTDESVLSPEETALLAEKTLRALMDSISPPVGSIVQRKSLLKLDVDATVADAAIAMREARMTAVLVFQGLGVNRLPYSHKDHTLEADEQFVGILTCKDVMSRVVAKGRDPKTAKVGDYMTPNPDTVHRNSSVLDALHIMQTEHYLHLPVVDDEPEARNLQEGVAEKETEKTTDTQDGIGNKENAGATPEEKSRSTRSASHPPTRICGILSVLDCAVHTFASSKSSAVQVLGAASAQGASWTTPQKPPRPAGSSTRSNLYYPTPSHGRLSSATQSLRSGSDSMGLQGGTYSHQQWRDPDSISAFSEVRSARKTSESDEEEAGAVMRRSRDLVADDLLVSVGPPATSATASDRAGLGAYGALVLKVKDQSDGKVYRISASSVIDFNDFVQQLEKATGKSRAEMTLVYLDEDRDRVQLANDSAFQEAKSLGVHQGWKKIDVQILSMTGVRSRVVGYKYASAAASGLDPVLVGSVLVASVALTVAIGLALFSSPQRGTNYSRKYR